MTKYQFKIILKSNNIQRLKKEILKNIFKIFSRSSLIDYLRSTTCMIVYVNELIKKTILSYLYTSLKVVPQALHCWNCMKLCMVVWVVKESLSTKFSLQISHVNFTSRWCRFVCLSTSVAFTPMKLHWLQGIVFGVWDFFTWAFNMNCCGYVFSQVAHLKGLWIPWTILRCATNLVTKWNFSWHRSQTFSFPSNLKVQFKIEIILEREKLSSKRIVSSILV